MPPLRRLAAPAYLAAALLVAIPLADAVLAVWPLHPEAQGWRFGAVGMFSRALMTPLLGVLLALAVAVAAGHRRAQATIAVVAALGGTALLLGGTLFLMDVVELRGQVRDGARGPFHLAALAALAKYAAAGVTLLVLAVAGRRALRDAPAPAARREPAAAMGRLRTRQPVPEG